MTPEEQAQRERDLLQIQRDLVLHLLSGGTLTDEQIRESGLGHGVLSEQNHHEYMRTKAENELAGLKLGREACARAAGLTDPTQLCAWIDQIKKEREGLAAKLHAAGSDLERKTKALELCATTLEEMNCPEEASIAREALRG